MGRDGAVKELVPAGRDGLGSAQGMEVDAARRILWVCSTAHKQARGIAAAEVGRAALHAFHADSGKPLGRYPIAGGEAGHSCDSLTLDRQGAVYVSDAVTGAVFRLPRGGKALEAFLPAGTLLSSQGPTFAADGKTLFIADYARGVMRVDVASRKAELLPTPPDAFLAGIDGLVFHGGSLYAVQNGVTPTRVLRLRLSPVSTASRASTSSPATCPSSTIPPWRRSPTATSTTSPTATGGDSTTRGTSRSRRR